MVEATRRSILQAAVRSGLVQQRLLRQHRRLSAGDDHHECASPEEVLVGAFALLMGDVH
jgi:hypothetical protein